MTSSFGSIRNGLLKLLVIMATLHEQVGLGRSKILKARSSNQAILIFINTSNSLDLYECHVDLIDIWSLLSVHLDADKVLLEDPSNLLALK